MKTKFIFFCIIHFFFIVNNLYSYEIIRDPIFENYFNELSKELDLNEIDVFLTKNKTANAFVIKENIYITTGLLETIKNEDTLKAIYLHEYGHITKNHFEAKKIKIKQSININTFYNLFSLGLAVLTTNTNIAIGTSITLNSNLVNEISKHSVNFEIEADNYMIEQIKKNKISIYELIHFLNKSNRGSNYYFMTHPDSQDRINNLKNINYKKSNNSVKYEWIKSKYSKNSYNQNFNTFFKNLEKGIYIPDERLKKINDQIIKYEAFKKGIFIENWENEFEKLLIINDNSFLKIEYINYLLDNNVESKFYIIENLKFNKSVMDEYFYYYIYGKYYKKINNNNLYYFYFCQFYKLINYQNKADFFCKKYDIKDIPILDKSYALFK